jgi:hypothetical protein
MQASVRRTVGGLLLFGAAFGYLEAAVVVYLRTIYEPLRQQLAPAQPANDLFPLIDLRQLRTEAPKAARLIRMEVVREAATLAMLAAVALVATGGRTLVLPCFAIVFGIWDLCFYAFLKLLIDWPASLMSWDLLFLIPVPWVAPVLAPVIVSASLIVCGLVALQRAIHPRPAHWGGLVLGSLLILLSFMLDFQDIIAGKSPQTFAWPLFLAGELLGVGAFVHAFRNSER